MKYSSKSLDHPGIVAGVCKEIELAAEIDRIVGIDKKTHYFLLIAYS
ncbi:Uncharacterised protein [uncultured archaeon]|nr:Uncharacterised protein [uncultured archaeon]